LGNLECTASGSHFHKRLQYYGPRHLLILNRIVELHRNYEFGILAIGYFRCMGRNFKQVIDIATARGGTGRPSLRQALPVSCRCRLIGGIASQPERPQPRGLFPHRAQLGLILGHSLLALTKLLFLLEQSVGATMRFIHSGVIE
jgi:hypothetical protein